MPGPICKNCGGPRVLMETRPGKSGKTVWYVGCPKCGKEKQQSEKPPSKKEPQKKEPAVKPPATKGDWDDFL